MNEWIPEMNAVQTLKNTTMRSAIAARLSAPYILNERTSDTLNIVRKYSGNQDYPK